MATQLSICNRAATILGEPSITAITDGSNTANAFNAVYNDIRDSEQRKNVWKFTKTRTVLSTAGPVPGDSTGGGVWTASYALPAGCLRVLSVGELWPAADLSDYRSGPSSNDWSIENGYVLTNLSTPLALWYVAQITAEATFDVCFAEVLAARLAHVCCFRITNSYSGQKQAMMEYKDALKEAVKANALESVPQFTGDDTWIMARFS